MALSCFFFPFVVTFPPCITSHQEHLSWLLCHVQNVDNLRYDIHAIIGLIRKLCKNLSHLWSYPDQEQWFLHLRKQRRLCLRNRMLRPHKHTFCWMGEWFHFSPQEHLPLSGYNALCITSTSSAQSKFFLRVDCFSVPLPLTAHCSAVSSKTKVTLAHCQYQFHYKDFQSTECLTKFIFNKIFSGQRLRLVVEWRGNQCFKDYLCACYQGPDSVPWWQWQR